MNDVAAKYTSRSRVEYLLLVGSIALIGADRIDLFVGRGPFTMTPFLLLAPLVIFTVIFPKWLGGNNCLTIARRQKPFLGMLAIFLFFALLSILFGIDPERGIVAFANLLLVSLFGYCISLRILVAPDRERLIITSITCSIIIYTLFCLAEGVAWSQGLFMLPDQPPTSWIERTFAAIREGDLMPRLDGTTIDPNRAGFVLSMYLALLDWFAPRSRYSSMLRIAIVLLIFLTLSKSAILCLFVYCVFSKNLWKRLASKTAMKWLAAIVIGSLFLYAVMPQVTGSLVEAWNISDLISQRLSMDSGSSGQSHVELIQRGFEIWETSAKTVFMGIGYGSAPKVLSDILNTTSKNSNFHCLYITVLAEMGLPAFVLMMLLLLCPIVRSKGMAHVVFAIMVFNISYQTPVEPIFWVNLALIWSSSYRNLSWLQNIRKDVVLTASSLR